MSIIALQCNEMDNVAVVFAENIAAGDLVTVKDKKGHSFEMAVSEPIPYGHKFAITDIPKDGKILKYGEEIGVATRDISKGEYVHVHNLNSQRGRGDLEKGEQ